MSDTEQRFALSMRQVDDDEPGLIRERDGTVWLVNPDGTRTQLPGPNGGSQPSLLRQIVRVATTGDSALSGLLTVDGVVLEEGDRVLACHQSTAADNGIYIASAGDWQRSTDYPSSGDQGGCLVMTEEAGDSTSTTLFMGWNQVPGDPDSPLRFAPIGSIDWTSQTDPAHVQDSLTLNAEKIAVNLFSVAHRLEIFTAEPDPSDMFAGCVYPWFDPANGAAAIHFKGKTLNGTVVTASLPLT